MNRGIEPDRVRRADQAPPPPHAEDSPQEVDLDRLIWDPEYRAAMRSLIKPAG